MAPSDTQTICDVATAWDRAMLTNDIAVIGAFMAEDWVIVGADGNVSGKVAFLAQVASGDLRHDVMETHDMQIRMYDGTAVMVARGVSGGSYRGTPFLLHERMSCVFVRQDAWRCVLTHLSLLESGGG